MRNGHVLSGKVISGQTKIVCSRSEKGHVDTVVVYEKRKWLYFFMLPLMWTLTLWVMLKKTVLSLFGKKPKINTFWFDGLGLSCRQVKEGVASWRALDVIYSYHVGDGSFIDEIWNNIRNVLAVRNRLKLVKDELKKAVFLFNAKEEQEVRILSLGCGSAQGIVELISELKGEARVRALLIDIDQTALDYAQELSEKHGISDRIETVKASAYRASKYIKQFDPQIVEMLGLLDYIPQDKAIRLVRQIHNSMQDNGMFFTCNVRNNPERYFLKWVIDWDMIYRSEDELREVAIKAGFRNVKIICEPLKVHNVIISKKFLC